MVVHLRVQIFTTTLILFLFALAQLTFNLFIVSQTRCYKVGQICDKFDALIYELYTSALIYGRRTRKGILSKLLKSSVYFKLLQLFSINTFLYRACCDRFWFTYLHISVTTAVPRTIFVKYINLINLYHLRLLTAETIRAKPIKTAPAGPCWRKPQR